MISSPYTYSPPRPAARRDERPTPAGQPVGADHGVRAQRETVDHVGSHPARGRPVGNPRTLARVLTGLVIERALGEPAPGWQRTGPLPLIWHNGATGTASVFAGAVPDGRWTVVHRLNSSYEVTDQAGLDYLRTAQPR